MTIVYCLSSLYKTGGIERTTTTKANYLAGLGHQIYIVTTDQGGRSTAFPLDGRIKLVDLELNYEADNALGRWGRLYALYRKRPLHKRKLEELFANLKPDIVVSTFFQEASILPELRDGSKKVLELHSTKCTRVLMHPPKKRLLRFLGSLRLWQEERIARYYDQFVCLTEEERPLWSRLPNVAVIPNARSFPPKEVTGPRTKVVLAIGRFEYQKNFEELIQIWSRIAIKYPDWMLHIHGDGHLHTRCAELIKQLGLVNLRLLPATPHIQEEYLRSSIYVMTSHYEGQGIVLLEAQAAGLPIVSYACPSGPRDIVHDGEDGFLIELYNQQAFAEALERLMGDEPLRLQMGERAQRSSERFSVEQVMAKWVTLFDRLLSS